MALGVHLNGSIPLPSSEDVFSRIPAALPGRLKRLPDGEPEIRQLFVFFQLAVFNAYPEIQKQYDAETNVIPPKSLPTKADLEALTKTLAGADKQLATTYDDHALSSYQKFVKARAEGKIPPGVKFQVSLATPLNVVTMISEGYQSTVEPFYEAALIRALDNIQDTIPAADLAIQWDVPSEFAMLEGEAAQWPHFTPWFGPDVKGEIIERLVRLVDSVREDVECGLHLCYGDHRHEHFIQPKDAGLLVEVANAVRKGVKRTINWIHLPVPKDRLDVAYYEPLKHLDVPAGTDLHLGLVHYDDLEGTRKRTACAKNVLDAKNVRFGVATECGMGRTPPEQLESILEISKAVSEPYAS
ncbi:hypothetical protein H2200_008382 [Cladophialophora chaetospira]|uniref:Uncharacterized protein n=1 Tax=Cladophialophora chaetospira TaxID=386627 RepID=A0AA38X5S2_9EURO|nr:hypothetical protein H2200_008382 [Cladophialophora chaetospira]